MNNKDVKITAQKIAQAEFDLSQETDPKKIAELRSTIVNLTSRAKSIKDMVAIDEEVQKILKKLRENN